MIILDSNSSVCMYKNGKDTKHTRHIARIMHFVRHVKKCKMHNIDWCEGGLKFSDIATNNVGEHALTPSMKYIMVGIKTETEHLYKRCDRIKDSMCNKSYL